MILPTPEFDPMFAEDGVPFRDKMIRYIQREFADLLGADVCLLDTEEGLETLSRIVRTKRATKAFTKCPPRTSREAA